jgi:signal peptidase I
MAPTIPAGTVLVQEPVGTSLAAGDIVLVREPKRQMTLLALRITALPESRIEFIHRSIIVNGKRPAGVRSSLVGPPFPWPGLEPEPGKPDAFRVPKDSYFVLADNPDEALDSRSFGVVPRSLIVGQVHKWSEVAKDRSSAKSYLERSIAALRTTLPLKIQDGMSLTSLTLIQNNEISLSVRLDAEYRGAVPLPDTELRSLRTALTRSYCQSDFGRYATDLSAKYVLSDPKRQLALFQVSSSACRTQ